MPQADAAIAAGRLGLGARPGELARIGRDPRGWAGAQLTDAAAFAVTGEGLATTRTAVIALEEYRDSRPLERITPQDIDNPGRLFAPLIALAGADLAARMQKALTTEHGFAERLALFWCNHFTVSATKVAVIPLVGPFEREAVRAHMTGTFGELLIACAHHAGMSLYLDQAQSAGRNSTLGRLRDFGLNENLAREILELHTLGVHGGYTQNDVTEFAKALTGYTLANRRVQRFAPQAQLGEPLFVAAMHEPGARTVLGRRYAQDGAAQAHAILVDLAHHPATARHIATKLCRHFIADDPPPAAVARVERAFIETRGHLPTVHSALLSCPELWQTQPGKFKTPHDFVISALRLIGLPRVEPRAAQGAFQMLGQPMYRAPSPAGWSDRAADWGSPDAVMKRLEWSQALAARTGRFVRPEDALAGALGDALSPRTREAVARAESAEQGLALALMSPEFQRR